MTNEAYTLAQTQKERSAMRRGAFAKKNGSKSKRCTLPSDNLTPAQKQALNGPVITVDLKKPMTYAELMQTTPSLRFLYLDHLINEYHARQVDLIEMLGTSPATFTRMAKALPGKLIFKGKPRRPAPEWLAFIGQKDEAPPIEPEPQDENILPATLGEDQPCAPAPEPEEKVDLNPPTPVLIQSGSFTIRGTAADLIATLTRLADPDEPMTYSLTFLR